MHPRKRPERAQEQLVSMNESKNVCHFGSSQLVSERRQPICIAECLQSFGRPFDALEISCISGTAWLFPAGEEKKHDQYYAKIGTVPVRTRSPISTSRSSAQYLTNPYTYEFRRPLSTNQQRDQLVGSSKSPSVHRLSAVLIS